MYFINKSTLVTIPVINLRKPFCQIVILIGIVEFKESLRQIQFPQIPAHRALASIVYCHQLSTDITASYTAA